MEAPAPPKKHKKVARLAMIVSFAFVFLLFGSIYAFSAYHLNNKTSMSFLILRPEVGANRFFQMEPVSGVKKQLIDIPCADGSSLNAWYFKIPNAQKLAIVSHGNAGNMANRYYLANALARAKCSSLLYDYRGYGLSKGVATVDGILEDGLTVYDYTKEKLGYSEEKIILLGESIGSGVATNLACNRKCSGVILVSGIGSLPLVGKNVFKFLQIFPDFIFAEPHLNNVERVRDIHVPILFLHGQRDFVVPYQHSEQMFKNANEPKRLVLLPNCGHNDMGVQDSETFQQAFNQFVESINQDRKVHKNY